MKHIITAAAIAALSATAANAQSTMYLVKGDHVVGKYATDAVDYVTFELPEGVREGNIWLDVNNAGKNTVTYTVNTIDPSVAYAHNAISYYEVNYLALNYYGDMIENLKEEERAACMQSALSTAAYMGQGTKSYTQVDFEDDGTSYGGYTSRFSIMPGTPYYLMAWEIDPVTSEPMETFTFTEFKTEQPGESKGTLDISFVRQNSEGLAFDFNVSSDIKYVRTLYGVRDVMEYYISQYGEDFTFGTFGQNWEPAALEGEGDIPGIEAATWPAYDPGEYVMMARGYDQDGNVVSSKVYATAEGSETQTGPAINVFWRSKENGKVSINFEITPSNVSEAYVNLMTENDTDDKLNQGYELYELAMSSTSTEITDIIHTAGEYTFTAPVEDENWYNVIVYARDLDGNRTAQRFSFNMAPDSEWFDYKPVYSAPGRHGIPAVKKINSKISPAINRR